MPDESGFESFAPVDAVAPAKMPEAPVDIDTSDIESFLANADI